MSPRTPIRIDPSVADYGLHRVPPNCAFEVDDLEQPWMWKKPFDFINSANLAQGIRDWPQYVKRIYDNLAPGGVVQLHEVSLYFHSDDDTIPRGILTYSPDLIDEQPN